MKRTNKPRMRRLSTPLPLVLVAHTGMHHCSAGCYTSEDTLCKKLDQYLERHPDNKITFSAYQWMEHDWECVPIDIYNGLSGMLCSLGQEDGIWEMCQTRKLHVAIKELHSVHPHAVEYAIIDVQECARPKTNASHLRTRQWAGSYLIECVASKTLMMDADIASFMFPTRRHHAALAS